jgi:hypothetical protein
MDNIRKIMGAIEKSEEELNERISLVIEKKCKGKNKEEIREYLDVLLEEPPEETGGQNALTGFYFQLLCTLYYLAELLEGKWDYLVIELHQDIVVGNDSTIRFVQVKSEVSEHRESIKEVSATSLYRGWVQKLISLSRLFPKGEGVITEFELITNYIIKNSPRVKVEHYLYNDSFDQKIEEDDDILEKLTTKYRTRGLEENFNFEEMCNETIEGLLSRFSISPKAINPGQFEDFIGLIGSKLGRLINESAGVSIKDINFLIGELVYECNHSNKGSLLYIDKERAYAYLEILKQRASLNLEDFYNINNSNKLIDEIITDLNEDYQELSSPLKEQVQDEFENFRLLIKELATEDMAIVEMVHRYLEGKSFSLNLINIKPLKIKKKAREVIRILFLFKILFNDDIRFSSKFTGILLKEVSNAYVSIIGLEIDQTKEEGIFKLGNILEKASNEEKLLLLFQNNLTIFQGEYDDEDFNQVEILRMDDIVKFSIDDIPQNKSAKKIDYRWTIIPGLEFVAIMRKVRRHNEFQEFKQKVHDNWGSFLK